MGIIIVKTRKGERSEMTKKQSKGWIQNTCLTYLIGQMLKQGYSVAQIAKCANISQEKVQNRIDEVIKKNWTDKSGLVDED